MASTLTRDDVTERDHERRQADKLRRRRTELLHLPWCRICGGATSGTDETEIMCVCLERQAEFAARLRRIVDRHTTPRERHWSDQGRE
jgi:hypothetical protein